MKLGKAISCLGGLALLTILNTWWHFEVRGKLWQNSYEETKDFTFRERRLREKLAAVQKDLSSCRADLLLSRDQPNRVPKSELALQDRKRESSFRTAELSAFQYSLANESHHCCGRLQLAVHELRRLRDTANVRALEAEASSAQVTARARSLSIRQVHTESVLKEKVRALQAKLDASMEIHQTDIANVARDVGFTAEAHRILKYLNQRIYSIIRRNEDEAAGGQSENSITAKRDSVSSGASNCVAIVVPFRGRGIHLDLFYRHIRGFLNTSAGRRLCWSVFIVEQYDAALFNRGWLFNVGVAMAGIEERQFKCVVIQDLDTLPEIGSDIDFGDCEVPTQLSSEIECYQWLPPYPQNAGGVVSMSGKHWYTINGFSNEYVGWGGEDDDLSLRLRGGELLTSSCEDFCNDSGFYEGMEHLIHRPRKGRGRFICLEEGSHTPRKHGDKKEMNDKLEMMKEGSVRWAYDGLSSLSFHLIRHDRRAFPNTSADTRLHWLKVTSQTSALRFSPDRLRFVLANGTCSEECAKAKACAAFGTKVPFTVSELRVEFARALGVCIARGLRADSLGFFMLDRQMLVTSLHPDRDEDTRTQSLSLSHTPASWALNEVLRVALDSPPDGKPVVAIRAVSQTSLDGTLADFRRDFARMQKPIVDVCTGTYWIEDARILQKQTVNVGSDDCEQRSWTHQGSFKALRFPRSPEDQPVCVGEADGVWTTRLDLQENCSGMALGVMWKHKAVFYVGSDAAGRGLCVRHKNETAEDLTQWSRWRISYVNSTQSCHGITTSGWQAHFSFQSMEDSPKTLRRRLCVGLSANNVVRFGFDCTDPEGKRSVMVLSWTFGVRIVGDLYCIHRNSDGDVVLAGRDCEAARLTHDGRKTHGFIAFHFMIPPESSGKTVCIGRRTRTLTDPPRESCTYRMAHMASCSHGGFTHELGFREVNLEDVPEEIGLLSLASA
eukprot:TRINITY_DN15305_c0_g1_i1.p1 TRINITY_DN15305_c0_g1~~TRINITY_DN15305_c0_g1_i1.p1  ORF type:complete len:950 (-),score=143.37 TRINITY_DN15305_c0_g1_i1:133-2982(-)